MEPGSEETFTSDSYKDLPTALEEPQNSYGILNSTFLSPSQGPARPWVKGREGLG